MKVMIRYLHLLYFHHLLIPRCPSVSWFSISRSLEPHRRQLVVVQHAALEGLEVTEGVGQRAEFVEGEVKVL